MSIENVFALCLNIFQILPLLNAIDYDYRIQEELPIGTRIGNLFEDVLRKSPQLTGNRSLINFYQQQNHLDIKLRNFMDVGVRLFEIKPNADLFVAGRIDREQLCPTQSFEIIPSLDENFLHSSLNIYHSSHPIMDSQKATQCRIRLSLSTKLPSSAQELTDQLDLNVNILIQDINDNAPQWPNKLNRFQIHFRDGDPVGERRTLPPATDADIGSNAKLTYELDAPTDGEYIADGVPFNLVVQPTDGISLYTTRPIDREERDSYQLLLKAIDLAESDGTNLNRLTSTLTIDIQVEDVNDNSPIFSQPLYTPNSPIPETVPIGTVVLMLNASDTDAGLNGAFVFSHSREHAWVNAEATARQYFDVRANGEIIVRRALNVDKFPGQASDVNNRLKTITVGAVRQFRFRVTVEDKAVRPYTRSSEATVMILISDENDESPVIKLQPTEDGIHNKRVESYSFGYLTVMENQPIGTAVAIVQAYDPDFDGTDHVECRVTSPNFTLAQVSTNTQLSSVEPGWTIYKLQTAVQLDRESSTVQHVLLSCFDVASHVTEQKVLIRVTDQNDNPPRFVNELFNMEVEENSPVGTIVRRLDRAANLNLYVPGTSSTDVLAVDLDAESNAQVSYYLVDDGANSTGFMIDQKTGVLSTKSVFDRELVTEFTFGVIAKDHGKPSLTGSAKVKVTIVDVNDNPPVFFQNDYIFHIMENQPRSTKLGQVNATDRDLTLPGSIHYYLADDPDAQAIRIDPITGVLRCWKVLDRESQSVYTFRVFARDGFHRGPNGPNPTAQQFTGTATVTVVVDDENDNWPVFISPNATANTLAVAIDDTLGHKLAYVHATDADEGENGLISYELRAGNTHGLFGLDSNSGLLYLAGLPTFVPGEGLIQRHPNQTELIPVQQDLYILTLEACDHGLGSSKKCTTFHNLKILIKRSGQDNIGEENKRFQSAQAADRRPHGYATHEGSIGASLLGWHRTSLTGYTTNEIVVICLATLFLFVLLMMVVVLFILRRKLFLRRLLKTTSAGSRNDPPKSRCFRLFNSFRSNPKTPKQSNNSIRTGPIGGIAEEQSSSAEFPMGNYKSACATYLMGNRRPHRRNESEEIQSDETINESVAPVSREFQVKQRLMTNCSEPRQPFVTVDKHAYQALDYLGLVNCSPNRQVCNLPRHKTNDTLIGRTTNVGSMWNSRHQCVTPFSSTADSRVHHQHTRSHPHPIDNCFMTYSMGEDTSADPSISYGQTPQNQALYTTDFWGHTTYAPDSSMFYVARHQAIDGTGMCQTGLASGQIESDSDSINGQLSAEHSSSRMTPRTKSIPELSYVLSNPKSVSPDSEKKRLIAAVYHEASFV